jgi:membrane-associated HD superfamily phosphohydrolase
MKILVVGVILFLASQFFCLGYAMDLCESEDYYNLADSSKCKIKYNETGSKSDSQELMFEVLKNYPYENKDSVIKLLQKKIERVGNYIIQQQDQKQTEKTEVNISKLVQAKQDLSVQLELVSAATVDNWVIVRDQATKKLREATIRLQEVE